MQEPLTSFAVYNNGPYKFLVDKSMMLPPQVIDRTLCDILKIIISQTLDENEQIKRSVISNIDWVVDVGIHTGLCIHEINCIVIFHNNVQYKFVKFFKKNIDELIKEKIVADTDLVYQLE
jgi:hypothetical protein